MAHVGTGSPGWPSPDHTKWQPAAGLYDWWSDWRAFHSPSYPDGNYARSDPNAFHTGMGAEQMIDVYVDFPNGLTAARYQVSPSCSEPAPPYNCWGDKWHYVNNP